MKKIKKKKKNGKVEAKKATKKTKTCKKKKTTAKKKKVAQQRKISLVMDEFKHGELKSGSEKGPKVVNPKQAIAIALSEARKKTNEK